MQVSGGGAEPKGWTDAEVDQLLEDVEDIEILVTNMDINIASIAQHTANMNEWTFVTRDSSIMLVFVLSTLLGYWLSAVYMPATSDIGRWR